MGSWPPGSSGSAGPFSIPIGLSTVSTADNAPVIQAALNLVGAAGGGTVLIPPGTYTIGNAASAGTMLLDMPSKTTLLMQSMGTRLQAAPNLPANITALISNSDTSAAWYGVSVLGPGMIYGDRLNQTHKHAAISFSTANQPGPFVDSGPLPGGGTSTTVGASGVTARVEGMWIVRINGDGIVMGNNMAETWVRGCFTYYTDNGITMIDGHVADTYIGYATKTGLLLSGISHANNLKVYYSGDGLTNPAVALSGNHSQAKNIEVQQSIGNAFVVSGNGVQLQGVADAVTGAGVWIRGSAARCKIDVNVTSFSWGAGIGTYVPTYGAYCDTSGVDNEIHVVTDGTMSIADVGGTTQAMQRFSSNKATVTTPSVASGTAFTPSLTQNSTVYFQLVGAVGGTYTVTMGPSTGAENTLYNAVSLLATMTAPLSIQVPANWKVVLTLVNATNPGTGAGANTATVVLS